MGALQLVRAAGDAQLRARQAMQAAEQFRATAVEAEAKTAVAKKETKEARAQATSARAEAAAARHHAAEARRAQLNAEAQAEAADQRAVAANRATAEANTRADIATTITVTVEEVAMRIARQAADQVALDRAATFAEMREIIDQRRAAERDELIAHAEVQAELRALVESSVDVCRQCLAAVENLRGDIAVKALAQQPGSPKATTVRRSSKTT